MVALASSSWPKDVRSPIVSYSPSKWADTFTLVTLDHQVQEKYAEAIEALKEEARSMLTMAKGKSTGDRLILIDTLERLGVAYHFDQEIEEQLQEIFRSRFEHIEEEEDHDLFIISLQFRLLRQHRHYASCSVFDKFTGKDNKFKETFSDDAKGLLSLYEAAHLRIHGEEILDEAVAFTVHHLKRMIQHLESPLQDQVKRALEQPLQRGSPRIETRYYISFYQKERSKNEVLLKLAKLDFNYLQNMYKKELCQVSRWWNELDLKSEFPHVRDRVVEAYLWGATFHFEPRYSYVRMAVAKSIQMLTILDDTYDNYATVEEADLFTELMERWNIDEIDQLPDYMKIIYRFFLSAHEDYGREAAEQGKLFALHYDKETVKQVCKAYNKETKWAMRREMPSFEEYIANTVISGCLFAICLSTIPGMESVTKETIDWLMGEPKIAIASTMVCRYLDDLSSFERESNQGKNLTGLDFYMKQHGVSMQETNHRFIELAEDSWKDLNTEWMAINSVPKDMLEQVVGYARASEVFYRSCQDAFAKTEVVAPCITALFVDPIIL